MKKIFLFGKHSKRTPTAYSCYRDLFSHHCDYVEAPDQADYLVLGFLQDIKENYEIIASIRSKNPHVRLTVLSEEPLWDTLWSGDFLSRNGVINTENYEFNYDVLNFVTTNIYKYDRFPYFITTNDNYFIRYANLFRCNVRLSPRRIREIWERAPIRQAYFLEKRIATQFNFTIPQHDIRGLCTFRTKIAEMAGDDRVLRVGKDWGQDNIRQSLPDWHLDKLATLNRQVYIISAMENTHHAYYVTEKIFDAFAVLGIPIYVAGSDHSVHKLIPEESYINVYGLTPSEAVKKINDFIPDDVFIEKYCEAQEKLASLFSDPSAYWLERKRVVSEVVKELDLPPKNQAI